MAHVQSTDMLQGGFGWNCNFSNLSVLLALLFRHFHTALTKAAAPKMAKSDCSLKNISYN
ncbi:hypothetical protein T4B_9548 [Trichinella pseudospiralis]|uniref:Uncharacterized protein n=1 Tax=Trichinella pseudospiralis TaxID=6337 RepID=A0A0V1J4V2_TRIPS|nr:hypothetical protein T4B_9548 [Trichinella pseudospiralis]